MLTVGATGNVCLRLCCQLFLDGVCLQKEDRAHPFHCVVQCRDKELKRVESLVVDDAKSPQGMTNVNQHYWLFLENCNALSNIFTD